MMRKSLNVIASFSVCLTLLFGCTLFRPVNYSIAFRNMGTREIWVYDSPIGKHASLGAGILPPDTRKVYFPYNVIPETVNIKWKNGSGAIVETVVEVKNNVPSRFRPDRGCIVFNIDDHDNVILSFSIEVGKHRWEEIDAKGAPYPGSSQGETDD